MAHKSMRVGGGGRFEALVEKIKAGGLSKATAQAIAAEQGRKKYGKEKMKNMAVAGRKRAQRLSFGLGQREEA